MRRADLGFHSDPARDGCPDRACGILLDVLDHLVSGRFEGGALGLNNGVLTAGLPVAGVNLKNAHLSLPLRDQVDRHRAP